MKNYLTFILKFFIISAVLFVLRDDLLFGYDVALLYVISQIDKFTPGQDYYTSSFYLIIFLSLLVATPAVSIKRRGSFIAIGLLIYFLHDLIGFLIWTTPPPPNYAPVAKAHITYSLIWRMLGQWVLPFVFWIGLARKQLLEWMNRASKKIVRPT